MKTLKEKWGIIHSRLEKLNEEDENEPELLSDAYEALIQAYQEARELNDEMEELVKEILKYTA